MTVGHLKCGGAQSSRYFGPLVQELWGKVCAVWPDYGLQMRVDFEPLEVLALPEWFKDRAEQSIG